MNAKVEKSHNVGVVLAKIVGGLFGLYGVVCIIIGVAFPTYDLNALSYGIYGIVTCIAVVAIANTITT